MKKTQTPRKTLAPGIAQVLKRLHYPIDVMLLCVRWYVAYSLSLRNLEEMMAEDSVAIRRCDMICADKTNPMPDETDAYAGLRACI